MVRAEDASQIKRIFEHFQLATVDLGSVKSEIERSRREKAAEEMSKTEWSAVESDKTAQIVDSLLQKSDKQQDGHMLRHIFCTRMILGGIDLKTVRIIMDHADAPKNMRVYANVTKTKAQNELMRMEGKMKLK